MFYTTAFPISAILRFPFVFEFAFVLLFFATFFSVNHVLPRDIHHLHTTVADLLLHVSLLFCSSRYYFIVFFDSIVTALRLCLCCYPSSSITFVIWFTSTVPFMHNSSSLFVNYCPYVSISPTNSSVLLNYKNTRLGSRNLF